MSLVLIVDDDPHIRDVVRFALKKAGFETAEAADGRQALEQFERVLPDLLVLDVMMPELDGTEVCRILRARSSAPIVFLTSRDDEIDRILGLELGGDDYVTKPFSPRELVARVKAVLRRFQPASASGYSTMESGRGGGTEPRQNPASPPSAPPKVFASTARVLRHGALELDLDRCEARWRGVAIVLTATELAILRTLLGYPGKVFSRDELMDGVYGHDVVVSDRTIDSHVRRVRRKFEETGADPIDTLHGIGYRLGACT